MIALLMIPIIAVCAIFWVRGIDYMKDNYPDYKGEDLFGEDSES